MANPGGLAAVTAAGLVRTAKGRRRQVIIETSIASWDRASEMVVDRYEEKRSGEEVCGG
jgi:SLT domain-containing protein